MVKEFIWGLSLLSNKRKKLTLTRKKDNIISGTKAGGKAAAKTNKERYGKDFYKINGAKGGKKSRDGGFASSKQCDCELIEEVHGHQRCAGIKGGLKSRHGKAKGDK